MEASKTTEVKENHIFTGILRFGSVFIPDTENVQELVKLVSDKYNISSKSTYFITS